MQRARYVLFIFILLGSSSMTSAQTPLEYGFELNKTYTWNTEVVLESDYYAEGERTTFDYQTMIKPLATDDPITYESERFPCSYDMEFTSGDLSTFQLYFAQIGIMENETGISSENGTCYLLPYFSPINDEYLSSLNDSLTDSLNGYYEVSYTFQSNTYTVYVSQQATDRTWVVNTSATYHKNSGVLLKLHYYEFVDQFGSQRLEEYTRTYTGFEVIYIPPYSYYAIAAISTLVLMIVLVIFYFVKKRRNRVL